jgi:murein L,D-transpeptidase YcbB/YkuD
MRRARFLKTSRRGNVLMAYRTRVRSAAIIASGAIAGFAAIVAIGAHAQPLDTASLPSLQRWTPAAASDLLAYIERVDSHGLEPADYAPAALRRALAAGNLAELDRQASQSFGLLARDLANGHVRPAQRRGFHIATPALTPQRIALLIEQALALRTVGRVLEGLAPQNPQYRGLRSALAALPAGADAERRKIEASLERWRWMPRELGARHLLVNIPEYQVRLIDGGREIAVHRVIVGKRSTPTPQFSAQVSGVIFNPPWNVPQSIIAESVGSLVRNSPATARARGYTWSWSGGTLRVTQQPGPNNALGQLKLDMPNPYAVFLHDTPDKELFGREERTMSHGCVRTDRPFDLAERLLGGTGWTRAMIDEAVASRRTQRIALAQPVPVYVVYLSAYVGADGRARYFGDPYGLDAAVNRLLDDRAGA